MPLHRVTFAVKPDMLAFIIAETERTGETRSDVVEQIVRERMKQRASEQARLHEEMMDQVRIVPAKQRTREVA